MWESRAALKTRERFQGDHWQSRVVVLKGRRVSGEKGKQTQELSCIQPFVGNVQTMSVWFFFFCP